MKTSVYFIFSILLLFHLDCVKCANYTQTVTVAPNDINLPQKTIWANEPFVVSYYIGSKSNVTTTTTTFRLSSECVANFSWNSILPVSPCTVSTVPGGTGNENVNDT
eukprot:PhF_6_TR9995/c0_g1_i1/m.15196